MLGDGGVGIHDVEIEACFLAVGGVDLEGDAVMCDLKWTGVGAVEGGDFFFEALGFSHGRVVAQDDGLWLEKLDEDFADEFLVHVHGEGGGLENEDVVVAIEDDAGQAVGFTPDDAAELFVSADTVAVFIGL